MALQFLTECGRVTRKCPNERQEGHVLVLTPAAPSEDTQQQVPRIQVVWAAHMTDRFGGERGLLFAALYSLEGAGFQASQGAEPVSHRYPGTCCVPTPRSSSSPRTDWPEAAKGTRKGQELRKTSCKELC